MNIIRKFKDFLKPNQEMDQDDVEDVKMYFTDLFDNLLDIGISRDDYKFDIDLPKISDFKKHIDPENGKISGWISFRGQNRSDLFDKFAKSEELKKFRKDLNNTEYRIKDNLDDYEKSDVLVPTSHLIGNWVIQDRGIYEFEIIKKIKNPNYLVWVFSILSITPLSKSSFITDLQLYGLS